MRRTSCLPEALRGVCPASPGTEGWIVAGDDYLDPVYSVAT